jgi:hypothetical protein
LGFSIDSFILDLEIQEINNIFRETKAEKALIRVLLKVVPELIEKEVKRVLSKDISKKEIKRYFLIIKKYIPETKKYKI